MICLLLRRGTLKAPAAAEKDFAGRAACFGRIDPAQEPETCLRGQGSPAGAGRPVTCYRVDDDLT
jgi:hypothetical protein